MAEGRGAVAGGLVCGRVCVPKAATQFSGQVRTRALAGDAIFPGKLNQYYSYHELSCAHLAREDG